MVVVRYPLSAIHFPQEDGGSQPAVYWAPGNPDAFQFVKDGAGVPWDTAGSAPPCGISQKSIVTRPKICLPSESYTCGHVLPLHGPVGHELEPFNGGSLSNRLLTPRRNV